MTPERWLIVKRLYQEALGRTPEDRSAFLDDACGGDGPVREAVQSLIADSSKAEGFLDAPAFDLDVETPGTPVDLCGQRLGPYEVQDLLGEGGMGRVYRARDTRLGRLVAIKLVPELPGVDRIRRFEREARALAALNHPNIAAIYGIEDGFLDSGVHVRALVLELVDGETLAEKLARRDVRRRTPFRPADISARPRSEVPGLPISESVAIARQIADALDAAHEKGIVHRDLKPANIKITPDGVVKVLDLGIAKAMGPDASGADSTEAPTVMTHGTADGLILGTPAYMSPEQARGKVFDKRTDIWAFGCVFYEMLTGRATFAGDTVADTIGRILEREPDWSILPTATPAPIQRLLPRCLAKDPKNRLRDIGDARIEIDAIDEVLAGAPEDSHAIVRAAAPGRRRTLPWVLGALALGGVGGALFMREAPAPAARVSRFLITTSADAPIQTFEQPGVAISPDGSRVVYRTAREGEIPRGGFLYMRAVDQVGAQPLRGADAANGPAFSRDGMWIVYNDQRDRALKRISALGGPPVTICALDGDLRGASWGPDGTIVFATDRSKGLLRVPSAGGTPERVTMVDPGKGEQDHWWPEVLPDGRAVLFTAWRGSLAQTQVAVVSLPNGQVTHLLDGTSARFSPTGHLVFAAADRTLRAVGFDARQLRVSGDQVAMLERVGIGTDGAAQFAVANAGSLIYATETTGSAIPPRTLVWVNRDGHEEPTSVPARVYMSVRLSPDGTRVALDALDEQSDIWIWDLARRTLQRLTNDPGPNRMPVWTPDGSRVAFSAVRDGVESVYWQAFDGSGAMERLSTGTQPQLPRSFSPDGMRLIFAAPHVAPFDLGVLSLGANRTADMVLQSTASESNGEISPDARWLAYSSDESGRPEIYVRPFPNVNGGRHLVSTDGGTRPRWSRTGSELFYYVPPGTIVAVPVQVAADLTFGKPQPVVNGQYALSLSAARQYDVTADGQRFLLLKDAPAHEVQKSAETEFHLVVNWFEELKRLVPLSGS